MLQIDLNKPILYFWSGKYIKTDYDKWIVRTQKSSYQTKIIIVTQGTIYVSVNEHNYKLEPGDCLIVPPFTKLKGTKSSFSHISFFWLQFIAKTLSVSDQDPLLISAVSQLKEHKYPTDANNYIFLPTKFKIRNLNNISLLFINLLSLTKKNKYSERGRDFFTAYFLIELSNDYLTNLVSAKTNYDTRIQNIKEWINVNLGTNLSVQTVADHFQMNASYLSRLFKKNAGVGVKTYILSAKLDHAKYLLLTTSLQINQIAIKVGFSDSKQFDHTFKKYYGINPTLYRQFFSDTHLTSPINDPRPVLPAEFGTPALQYLIRQIVNDD